MSFEAIDGTTGRTLGEAHDLPSDALHQLTYEPEARKLYFYGNLNSWEIDFGQNRLPLILEHDGMAGIVDISRN